MDDESTWQERYELLRDAIMEHLNPSDDDAAEEHIMIQAIEDVAKERDRFRRVLEDIAENADDEDAQVMAGAALEDGHDIDG